MDIDANQALATEGLWQIGVKVHVISTKFGQTLTAKKVIRKAFNLTDRIEAVENAFLNLGPRRCCSIYDAANHASAKV